MENIDTSSAGERLVFHLMAALAEFERSLISERTKAGMGHLRHGKNRFHGTCKGGPVTHDVVTK
jgi:DNA invertase Pin-like site-specific DNA recombinase